MKEPEAEEHGNMAHGSDGNKCEAFCLQRLQTDGGHGPYFTGAQPHRLTASCTSALHYTRMFLYHLAAA